jgi:isoleucyl-tRNA synthetase
LRRSSQTAIHHIFSALVRILAPVITFTADEAWSYATNGQEYSADSIHLQDWPGAPAEWTNPEIAADVTQSLVVRTLINGQLEDLRKSGAVGKSLDANVVIRASALKFARPEALNLAEIFMVSGLAVVADAPQPIAVFPASATSVQGNQLVSTPSVRCPRCWRWVPVLVSHQHGDLCPRCVAALAN